MSDQIHLTPKELARRLRTSPRAIQNMRHRGTGPDYIRVGARKILYPLHAVEAWEAARYVNAKS